MLMSLGSLERIAVNASDGAVGCVEGFLFDDEEWLVRYLVVRTSGVFHGREVVLSPTSLLTLSSDGSEFSVALTKAVVLGSPPFDPLVPFSRDLDGHLVQYYGHQPHWGYEGHWGKGTYPSGLPMVGGDAAMGTQSGSTRGKSLWNAVDLRGYHVMGTDAEIGHVEDFVLDAATWEIRYLVVDTSNWWFGKKVMVYPRWIVRIDWEDRLVFVDMTRHAIENSPGWEEPVHEDARR